LKRSEKSDNPERYPFWADGMEPELPCENGPIRMNEILECVCGNTEKFTESIVITHDVDFSGTRSVKLAEEHRYWCSACDLEVVPVKRECVGCGWCCMNISCGWKKRETCEFLYWDLKEGRYRCQKAEGDSDEVVKIRNTMKIGHGCIYKTTWRSDVRRREKDETD